MIASFCRISVKRRSRSLFHNQGLLEYLYMDDLLNLWFRGLYDAMVAFRLASLACFFTRCKVAFHLDLLAPSTRTGSASKDFVAVAIRVAIPILHEHMHRLSRRRLLQRLHRRWSTGGWRDVILTHVAPHLVVAIVAVLLLVGLRGILVIDWSSRLLLLCVIIEVTTLLIPWVVDILRWLEHGTIEGGSKTTLTHRGTVNIIILTLPS